MGPNIGQTILGWLHFRKKDEFVILMLLIKPTKSVFHANLYLNYIPCAANLYMNKFFIANVTLKYEYIANICLWV